MTITLDDVRKALEDPNLRLSTCLHEAGHGYYARRAGAIDICYHGPLEYPDRPGEFGSAGVVPVFPDEGINVDLMALARWFAAGAVVQKRLVSDFTRKDCAATDFEVIKTTFARRQATN